MVTSKFLRTMQPAFISLCLAGGSMIAVAQTPRDLSVEQTQAFQTTPSKPSSLSALVLLDRADATYAIGEDVRLAIRTNEDAYITVFNIGASGRVTQLFPNGHQTNNRIKANETIGIPDASSGVNIKVTGPVGAELIKVIATSKPVKIIPDANFQAGAGIFRSVDGGVAALNRDLAVVAANDPKDVKVAVVNQIIKTIPVRQSSMVPASPIQIAAPPADKTFPIVLSVGKSNYKVGEAMTIVAIPSEACSLTVFSVDQNGRSRLIVPSAMIRDTRVAAGQAMIVSGSGSPQSAFPLAPGIETITALCSKGATALSGEYKALDSVLTADEAAKLERDLGLVANPPAAAAVGYAQTTVTVSP